MFFSIHFFLHQKPFPPLSIQNYCHISQSPKNLDINHSAKALSQITLNLPVFCFLTRDTEALYRLPFPKEAQKCILIYSPWHSEKEKKSSLPSQESEISALCESLWEWIDDALTVYTAMSFPRSFPAMRKIWKLPSVL
jgi:hypothetical protein